MMMQIIPAVLALIALLPALDDTADGGRPRKYGSNAERQAAYRRRKAARK